jgi:predicted HTH domain antitoxin
LILFSRSSAAAFLLLLVLFWRHNPFTHKRRYSRWERSFLANAVALYRSGAFSHYQASQLPGLSRFAFDGFLKERHIYNHAYGVEDLEQDEETPRQLQSNDSSRTLLPSLHQHVLVPPAVLHELAHPDAPEVVAQWLLHLPDWIEVRRTAAPADADLEAFCVTIIGRRCRRIEKCSAVSNAV